MSTRQLSSNNEKNKAHIRRTLPLCNFHFLIQITSCMCSFNMSDFLSVFQLWEEQTTSEGLCQFLLRNCLFLTQKFHLIPSCMFSFNISDFRNVQSQQVFEVWKKKKQNTPHRFLLQLPLSHSKTFMGSLNACFHFCACCSRFSNPSPTFSITVCFFLTLTLKYVSIYFFLFFFFFS